MNQLTDDQIRLLASTSAGAANILKEQFPHLFVADTREAEDLSKIDVWNKFTFILTKTQRIPLIERVPGGIYASKGFLVNDFWDWDVVRDDLNRPVLVPFKRTVRI
jgi:hypothetical protein